MPNYYSEKIYNGSEAIVVAIDIGTTQSAVSFAYFSPGNQPQGKMVAHWPGMANWSGAAKTPSMVSYRNGLAKACGAEASRAFEEGQEDVAYWFKLHLHPAAMTDTNPQGFEIPPLPVGVSIVRVYADLMRYLMENTRAFFEKTTADGAEIWARLRSTIVVVLATPNGWDMREQVTLRHAAIRAGLVTQDNAEDLLQFVTESEASVHYALANNCGNWLKKRTVFAVIDCGGSTVDTTVYQCISTGPLRLQEACPSECVQVFRPLHPPQMCDFERSRIDIFYEAGGIFVNRQVKTMLENKLKGSAFSDPEIIKSMVDAFENELKRHFDGIMEKYELKFGVIRDNDPSLGICKGRITLSDRDIKPVFDTVTTQIIASCSKALLGQEIKYVILVGGFAESPYVRSTLGKALGRHGMQIITVGDEAKKAAAEGAIIGHIKQFVVARAAKATFGGCVRQLYDRKLHHRRRHAVQLYADGKKRIDGAFHVWITKGAVLQATFAHKLSYHVAWNAASTSTSELSRHLQTVGIEVFAWESDCASPLWCKDEQGVIVEGMRLICTLCADLSQLAGGIQMKTGSRGNKFYRVNYDVCVYFGGTQVRAKLQWRENGVLREGPVTVMPGLS